MKPSPSLWPFALSAVLHLSMGSAAHYALAPRTPETIEITAVEYTPPVPPAKAALRVAAAKPPAPKTAAKKAATRKSIPAQWTTSPPAKRASVPAAAALPPQPKPSAATARPPAVPKIPAGSAELLADPLKGRIFMAYFGKVKTKIDATARNLYGNGGAGAGSVSLYFVLNRRGEVESVSVPDGSSQAAGPVREFAIRCLKISAPFEEFPKELGVERIPFSVTILFEER